MTIRLLTLEPQFLKYTSLEGYRQVDTLAEADGILFLCPKCFAASNATREGVHSVVCWFEDKVPDTAVPGPGRWNPTGTGYDDLSFVPGKRSNSVLLVGGCAWHGFITDGGATILPG